MKAIAVLNQKGGVGKTTTTVNVSHELARQGYRVMAIDLDPQSHLTAGFGIEAHPQVGVDEVLSGQRHVLDVALEARPGLSVVPAGTRLAEVEQSVRGIKGGHMLAEEMAELQSFDYVLMDCPPSAAILTMNALLASGEVLIPVSSDFLALHGLSRLMGILQHIESRLHHALDPWIVLTRFQKRRRLAKEVQEKLLDHFPGRVLHTAVRENVALAESPGHGRTIFEHNARSNGARDYEALTQDLIHGRTLQ